MGEDKALISFGGQRLIERALSILTAAGVSASIAGAHSSLTAFAPVVEDGNRGLGPLSGICAALQSTAARWCVFLPVDLPLMSAGLIAYLLDHARTTGLPVTVSSVNGFAQTFPSVVERTALPGLLTELKAERRGCLAAFKAAAAMLGEPLSVIPVELAIQPGHVAHPHGLPAAYWFDNINTPADLRWAEARVGSRIGSRIGPCIA
jgi:molybdopterin-guanine dinucleotide biosynthesis protein A